MKDVVKGVPVEVYESLNLVPEITRALRCHIQKGVMQAIEAGHTQFHAELRRVTCLFVNLKKLSLDSQQQQDSSTSDITSEESASNILEKINKDYESAHGGEEGHSGTGGGGGGGGVVQHVKRRWRLLRSPVDRMQVHKALYLMQAILFHYEGVVRQFLVDDKGTVFIGVFGSPMNSHEDDW